MRFEDGPFRSHVLVEWVGKKDSFPSLPSSFQEAERSKAKLVGVKNQVLCMCCAVFSFNSAACHIRLVNLTTELGYRMARRFLPLEVQEPV